MFKKTLIGRQTRQPQLHLFWRRTKRQTGDECRTLAHTCVYPTGERGRKKWFNPLWSPWLCQQRRDSRKTRNSTEYPCDTICRRKPPGNHGKIPTRKASDKQKKKSGPHKSWPDGSWRSRQCCQGSSRQQWSQKDRRAGKCPSTASASEKTS